MTARAGTPFTVSDVVVGVMRDGAVELLPNVPEPPPRVDGHSVGLLVMTRNPPHGGELHPDGGELLVVVSGRVGVHLELGADPTLHELGPGLAIVVPRGVWHRVVSPEPTQLLHVTPGPGGEHRPPPAG